MKWVTKTGTAAVVSALLLSVVPQAWAVTSPLFTSSTPLIAPGKEPVAPAAAEAKISKEQAVELAKKYIDIPEEYTLQSADLNSYSSSGNHRAASWNLSFGQKTNDQYYGNMNITINGTTGRLTEYSFYDNDPDHKPKYPPKTDYKGAKEAAGEWIAKLNPDERDQLQYNDLQEQSFRPPLDGSFQYNLVYERTVDGIPFPQNGITLNVNGDGIVTGYSFKWEDSISFEKAAAISQEAAAQAFREQTSLSLTYQFLHEARGEKRPFIAYNLSSFLLNAVTGEPWDPSRIPLPAGGEPVPLTEKPLGNKPTGNLNLTKEQAIEKVAAAFQLPGGAKLEDASYNETANPDTAEVVSAWNLRWNIDVNQEETSKGGANIWAAVNSKTGEITNFSRYLPTPYDQTNQEDAKVSIEEAKAKAIEFIKKQLPAYTHQLTLDTKPVENVPADQLKSLRSWDLHFQRIIDGVYANYESVSVGIDRTTGDVIDFNVNFSNFPYPARKPKVLPAEQAKELLLSPYEIKLAYLLPDGNLPIAPLGMGFEKYRVMAASGELPTDAAEGDSTATAAPAAATAASSNEAKLVYMLAPNYNQEPYFLDAVTGQWRNASNGEAVSLAKLDASDIEGHWAQKELQVMIQR